MGLVRVAGESLGEMAWREFKNEVIKRTMIGIKRGLNEERDQLDRFLNDNTVQYGKIREYVEERLEELESDCSESFKAINAMDTAEKDLDDFSKEEQGKIRDLLVLSAKALARRNEK